MMTDDTTVQQLDIFIGNDDELQECAVTITRRMKAEWAERDIRVKIFTDGITNRLVGCYRDDAPNDVVLIRVYGEKTELFIDRKIEIRNMQLMHAAGLSPPLFCSFRNGICYGYTPGQVLDHEMVRDATISRLIAEKLAEMHSVVSTLASAAARPASNGRPCAKNTDNMCRDLHGQMQQPMLFRTLRRYLDLLASALADERQNKR